MKFIVVDAQGYSIPEFQVKELAVYDGKQMKNYVFKSPIPFHALNEDHQKQVLYLDGNLHGLFYGYGKTDYDEIYSILYNSLQDVDTIYVKGHGKKNFLEKTLSIMKYKLPKIVNLEFVSGDVPKLEKNNAICDNHHVNFCKCSVSNAYILYDYIVSLLPK